MENTWHQPLIPHIRTPMWACIHTCVHATYKLTSTRKQICTNRAGYDVTDDVILWDFSPECDLSPTEKSPYDV